MGFSRQEYWSGLPFSRDLPDPDETQPCFPEALLSVGEKEKEMGGARAGLDEGPETP